MYGYDAEAHADEAVARYLEGCEPVDAITGVSKRHADMFLNWFLPAEARLGMGKGEKGKEVEKEKARL